MNKLAILYHYFRAKKALKFSGKKLEVWQEKHQKKIERFAARKSSFYRENGGKIVCKKSMMNHFTTFNTRGISKEDAMEIALSSENSRRFDRGIDGITIGLSSGTSGNRGLFLVSDKERAMWCGNILAKVLPKAPWKRQKIALFLRANSTLYETISSSSLVFRYFDLLEDIDVLKRKLSEFSPDVLVAPPSVLDHLIGCCNPSRVISVAETLTHFDKCRLEKGFGQRIFEIYQCTEGFLGFTCSHGTFHLNEDLIYFEKEYLDETRFIPIITDLFRETQPIIRYRLDDVLVEKRGQCQCGCAFQAIERIEGRCDDVLYVRGKDGQIKPLFPDFISRRILMASEKIEEFEVVQKTAEKWSIYIEKLYRKEVLDELTYLFDRVDCIAPKIDFAETPTKSFPGAKRRRIRRECAAVS